MNCAAPFCGKPMRRPWATPIWKYTPMSFVDVDAAARDISTERAAIIYTCSGGACVAWARLLAEDARDPSIRERGEWEMRTNPRPLLPEHMQRQRLSEFRSRVVELLESTLYRGTDK
jgi:hypothetical protein